MSKNAIEVRDVRKRFYIPHTSHDSLKTAITQAFKPKARGGDEFYALDGVSFDVEKGDFFGVLGRNGSGKSTLLKIISEIYNPTNGSVKHKGKLVSFIELGVGFKKELTGRENVFLNSALLGFSKSEIETMYDDIVEFAELEQFMDQQLKNYSSGMRVRLAFSVAIRAKADILILDEVLAVGDAAFKKKCNDYFETLKDNKKTVILVTHGMGAVRKYCNKAVVIENGKIIFNGSGEDAADEYINLFEKQNKESVVKKEKQDRTGSGEVSLEKIDVLVQNDEVEVSVKLQAKQEMIDDVRFGFRVMDGDRVIAGVNNVNAINGQKLKFDAHQKLKLVFKMPNIFANKTYSITTLVVSNDGIKRYDVWRNATTFTTTNTEILSTILLPATLKIE